MPNNALVTHERTAISQQNQEIETNLVDQLNGYLNIIRGVLDKSHTKWTDFKAVLQPKFYSIVQQSIREAATLSYQLGAAYTADKVGLPSFLTTTDIANIKALTNEFTNRFFGRIQLAIDSTLDRQFLREPADSNINPNYIATSIAIAVCTKSLARGSLLKARSIVTQGKAGIMQAAAPTKKKKKKAVDEATQTIQDEIDAAQEAEDIDALQDIMVNLGASALIGAGVSALLNMRWVWLTQPGACLQYCIPLEGQTFDILDNNIPMPISDTHPNCRCRLLLA
jgi:hypothetical protein